MTISLLSIIPRKYFARAFSNGETLNGADLDAMYADLCEANNRNVLLLRQIANVNGGLQAQISSITSFTATAAQTAFTVPTYNTATDKALAYSAGALIAPASVTLTSATVVTLPAQTAGTSVTIVILTTGAGTTALASTSTGQGASLVGIEDAGGLIISATVEGALQEIAGNLASSSYLAGVLTLSGYVPKSGATMTGNLAFGGTQKVTGLAAATANGEAVRWEQIQLAALLTTLNPSLAATYLPFTGGTILGNLVISGGTLAMSTGKITGLGAATVAGDAVRYEQWQATDGSYITSGTVPAARLPAMVGASATVAGTQGAVPAPAAGNQSKQLWGDGLWHDPAAVIGSGYIIIQDQKASGTAAGGSTAATWNTRNLNTEVVDTGNHCTLSANQFQLAAGTYRLRASAPAHRTNFHRIKLYDVTNSANIAQGSNAHSDSSDATDNHSFLTCRFACSVPTTYEIRHFTTLTIATNGLGQPVTTGDVEVYCTVEIERE